jgi:two-component sensor histidine kinase/PAS domain-containing protein
MALVDSKELRQQASARVHEHATLTPDQLRERGGEDALSEALNELQIHQAELEIQNEELRQTQDRLAAVSERYHKLFSDAPIGYACIDRAGMITNINRAGRVLLNIQNSGPPGFFSKAFSRDHSDEILIMLDLAQKKGRASGFEFSVSQGEGQERVLQIDAVSAGPGQDIYVTLTDVTEAHKNRESLAEALEQNRLMGRETYHRIMNSLQLLLGLIQLQLAQNEEQTAQSALESVSSRIQAIIRSQAALRGLEDQTAVDLVKHLNRFIDDLREGVASEHEISFESRLRSLSVSNNIALYVSLIVNELVTNAIKYAYPDTHGPVHVILRPRDEAYEILVQDDGVGMLEGKTAARAGSLGLQLVKTLSEGQLEGSWTVNTEHGTTHAIRFQISQE